MATLSLIGAQSRAADENPFVFIAGYNNMVTCFELNAATGEMKELSRSDCGKAPTYMSWHPSRKFITPRTKSVPERSPRTRSIRKMAR